MMLLVAISTIAIPAKPGVWRTISLTDGTQVKVQLVGDEFMHYYQSADGTRYQYDKSTGNYYLQSETSYALTSSSCHPKIFVKEFSYFLMPCHQHGLRINLLVQR